MTVAFPSLTPTSRKASQGQYPVKRFSSISGTGTTRIYGSQPFNASLDLEFANISNQAASLILECYDASRGSYEALSLPNELWDGSSGALRDALERDYIWRFAEQPSITSVSPSRSTATVRLEGHRDG